MKKNKAWVNPVADRSTLELLTLQYILVNLVPNPVIVIIINKRLQSRFHSDIIRLPG